MSGAPVSGAPRLLVGVAGALALAAAPSTAQQPAAAAALPRLAATRRVIADDGQLTWPTLALMHPGGTGVRRVGPDLVHSRPAWSRDGWRLAFVAEINLSFTELFLLEPDGSYRELTSVGPNSAVEPSWSPDGRRLAYTCWCDEQADIYAVTADGTGAVRLTSDPANDYSPAWSPDGATIVFASNRDGDPRLYIMNADGSDIRRLSDAPGDQPAWSPDGSRIAFAGPQGGRRAIVVMERSGASVQQLTREGADDSWPAWSPDGAQLAFARGGGDDSSAIFIMNADGSAARRITGAGSFSAPAWGPPPAGARPDVAIRPGTLVLPRAADRSRPLPVVVFLPATFGTARMLLQEYVGSDALPGDEVARADAFDRWAAEALPQAAGGPGFAAVLVAGTGSPYDYASGPNWSATIQRYERQVFADLRRFAAAHPLDTTRVVLAGFSLGGDLAWALALRNPDRFAGAVVMGSRASYRSRGADHQALAAGRRRFVLSLGADEDPARVAGAQAAARLLAQLGVEHRLLEAGAGHAAAPAAAFAEALRFVLRGPAP